MGTGSTPDQDQFESLATLKENGEFVVRLYLAPIPGFNGFGTHPWYLVKRPDATEFDRWEVLDRTDEPLGYVHLNFPNPDLHEGTEGAYVLAELIGSEAEAVVDFIEAESPNYPCRNEYLFLPGPNSNTYGQWILDGTGWDVTLPFTAGGKDFTPDCE